MNEVIKNMEERRSVRGYKPDMIRKEDLDTIHDCSWWRSLIEKTPGIEILSIHEMESNEEVWKDWLACDNEYARGDRRIFEAGGGKYLNFIAIILKRL